MTTLTDFLLTRIAEDEAKARAADSGRWLGQDKGITFEWDADDWHDDETQARLEADMHANQHHISNWGPRRVLAECEAKRRIVELHVENESRVAAYRSPRWHDAMNDDDRLNWRKAEARCAATESVIHTLAQVYADHPDYQPEWSA